MKPVSSPSAVKRFQLPYGLGLSLALAACSSPAFLNLDPWPGAVREEPSDAWLAGERHPDRPIEGASPAPATPQGEPGDARTTLQPAPQGERHDAPLYSWDGGVVDGPERGSVVAKDDPSRGLEPAEGGRMYLLELYQEVLDERDHLKDETLDLRKALGEIQARIDTTSTENTGLGLRLAAVEAEVQRLTAENEDLAARLATAQIRRLEAEKLLLETRVEWFRSQGITTAAAGDVMPVDPMKAQAGGRK